MENKILTEIIESTTISFLGRKGLGKTVGSAILINNIQKDCLILDVTGAYTQQELIPTAKHLEINAKQFDRHFIIEILKKFKDNKKIVVNLQRLTRKELVDFSENLFKVLNEVGDCAVVIDEVGEIVSQQREFYSPELERTCRIGRNYGIRPFIIITQRAQKVDKNILALSDYYIVMGLTHNLDLEAVKELIGYNSKEFLKLRESIKGLKVGEFYLIKYDGEIKKAKFNMNNNTISEVTNATRQKRVLESEE